MDRGQPSATGSEWTARQALAAAQQVEHERWRLSVGVIEPELSVCTRITADVALAYFKVGLVLHGGALGAAPAIRFALTASPITRWFIAAS